MSTIAEWNVYNVGLCVNVGVCNINASLGNSVPVIQVLECYMIYK